MGYQIALTRRQLLRTMSSVAVASYVPRASSQETATELTIDSLPLAVNGRKGQGIAVNGSIPGPILRLREGQEAVIKVTNRLAEISSIHWHGVILPQPMDGVPGVTFGGIPARGSFTYRFPVRQSGTYWAHSHSGGQELLGLYLPVIIEPREPEPFQYERDYVVMLSDWSFDLPATIISKLKKQSGYFNYQKRTLGEFVRDTSRHGFQATVKDRLEWSKARMDPTDFADVTGSTYTYLLNGLPPEANWTGLFSPGDRVRLRFIAAGAMTYFDVRIPNLRMTVVAADGQYVEPVLVDEFRIAPGETFDVIVQPQDRAYTVFAEAMDRSGYTRGTLAREPGMSAPIPPRRSRPLRTMVDMGMQMTRDMPGMPGMKEEVKGTRHGPDTHGAGNSMVPTIEQNRLDDPGSGFEDTKGKVLVYSDLRSSRPQLDQRPPQREIELHITGNMERYMWSFNGKTYSEARDPIPFRYGERLRLILVNDTMMEHPIHLHGMWMELENGGGPNQPRKHTISVKPAERITLAITADALGRWALHCHLLLHMELGMFRVVEVAGPEVQS